MSRIVESTLLYAVSNPYKTFTLAYAVRHAPIPMAKATIAVGKWVTKIAGPTATLGRSLASIAAKDIPGVANAARVIRFGAPIAAGAIIGATAGTAIATTVWGQEGNELAIDFYSGGAEWYEYLPSYNAGKIVHHYITT
tara:strand:- start:229 stop:645 length:417 start_codon:yes stop_codon:yes gene_type:complete